MTGPTAVTSAKRAWTIMLPALFLGTSMFIALIVSSRIGTGMVDQVVPLQNASTTIRNELSLCHLSFEQALYVTKSGYYETALGHLDKAERYAHLMLEGGRDEKEVYIPLKDPELRIEITLVLEELKELRSLAGQRIKMGLGKATASEAENEFEYVFKHAYQQAEDVERALHTSIYQQSKEYEAITMGLLVACVLFTLLTGIVLYLFAHRRSSDIAALTETQERLRKHERELTVALDRLRLLSAAVEEAPDGIQLVGLDGRIVYSNKAVEEIYGFRPEELQGRHVNELNADPEFADKVILPSVMEKGHWIGELMVKHKGGGAFPIWLTASLVKDGRGNPISTVGIIRDITERKRAEEALRYQKSLLECLSEASIDGILVVGDGGRIMTFNRRLVDMWGIPEQVVKSRSDEAALQSVLNKLVDPDGFMERVRQLYENKFESSHEEIRLKDGRTFDRYSAPVMGADVYYGRVWFFRDITERKVLERQRADFYAMVTHDLKSPLAAILGYSELLLSDRVKLDSETSDIVSKIYISGKKLLNIVEGFLTFSRLESGTASLSGSMVDIAGLMQETAAEFVQMAGEKGLKLEVENPAGLPRVIMDRRLVERALQNLLQNAVSYTPAGGLVTMKAGLAERHGRQFIAISVTDTGSGIPPEEQGRVFEKYYRSAKTAGVKGTGLGLAIVKAVMQASGGEVELESAGGKGSTFRLLLPVK